MFVILALYTSWPCSQTAKARLDSIITLFSGNIFVFQIIFFMYTDFSQNYIFSKESHVIWMVNQHRNTISFQNIIPSLDTDYRLQIRHMALNPTSNRLNRYWYASTVTVLRYFPAWYILMLLIKSCHNSFFYFPLFSHLHPCGLHYFSLVFKVEQT